MIRLAALGLVLGAVALGFAAALGAADALALTRSALAAWLVVVSLPLGALPIVMMLDLAGAVSTRETRALRLLVAALPLIALVGAAVLVLGLAAPRLIDITALYGWSAGGTQGLAASWFTPKAFMIRSLVYLAIWLALGLVFARPAALASPGRGRLAALGLGLHLVVGSLAAIDWTMSLEPGLKSSGFGLLLMTLQSAFALTVALGITLVADRAPPPRGLVVGLLVALAAAAFLQFTQYLVVWSANLPREVVWYQHRLAGYGAALSLAAPVIVVVALLVLGFGGHWLPALIAIKLLALVEIAGLLWLVTPSWRGGFTVTGLDALTVVGFCWIGVAVALVVEASGRRRPRHG